jgi:hypothetical protein
VVMRLRDLVGLSADAPVPGPRPKRTPRAERAAGPIPSRKDAQMTEDRVLSLPDVPTEAVMLAEARRIAEAAVASATPASAPQQAVLAGVAPSQEPVVSASNGYTKTRLGTIVLVGNVGASKNIVAKRVAGRDLVEFSFAARTLGADAPTWYRVTVWDGDEATLDLIRQGTYLQIRGQAVQSQSHRTGRVFLDVTASRLAEGPAKGQQLTVAGGAPQAPSGKGYLARLWDALRGR